MEHLYHKHLFVCTNQRPEGARTCCGEAHGTALVAALKKEMKDRNLPFSARVQKTGCFDLCEKGPVVAVYPDGFFYGSVQLSDVAEIVDSLIDGANSVERLRIHEKG